jgi:hypothetical protein
MSINAVYRSPRANGGNIQAALDMVAAAAAECPNLDSFHWHWGDNVVIWATRLPGGEWVGEYGVL